MYGAEPRYNDIPGLTISFYCSLGISLNRGSTVNATIWTTVRQFMVRLWSIGFVVVVVVLDWD